MKWNRLILTGSASVAVLVVERYVASSDRVANRITVLNHRHK